jgi:hypothetical protein
LSQQTKYASGIFLAALLILSLFPILNVEAQGGNNCNGTLTTYGRCEQNTANNIITIGANTLSTSSTFTFPTPFTNNPFVTIQTINVTYNNGFPSIPVPMAFVTTRIFPWVIPAAFTEFGGNSSNELYFDSPVFQSTELTVTFSSATIPALGAIMYVQVSGDSINWTTIISMPIDGTNPNTCVITSGGSVIMCQFGITQPALPPLVNCCHIMRIATSGGDGVTKILFSEIQVHFLVFFPPVVQCVQPVTVTPKVSFIVKCFIPFVDVLGAITVNIHWKAVSETG